MPLDETASTSSSEESQKEAIQKLRERIADFIKPGKDTDVYQNLRERIADVIKPGKDTDVYLRKWLVARNFDLDKAEEMLRKHILFIKTNSLENIDEQFDPPKAMDYFHTAHLGYDEEGSSVRILHIGASDLRGLVHSFTKMDTVRMATHILLNDVKRQKVDRCDGVFCDKQVYIFDLLGLSWSAILNKAVAERTFYLLKCYEANFPENLKAVYVINAPSFFSYIYSWLKTVLPMSILSKLEIVSQENARAVLSQTMDPSIVPEAVGGTRVGEDGDPNCPFLYKLPLDSRVPADLLLSHQLGLLDSDPQALRATVAPGASLALEVEVGLPGSLLGWEFQTQGYDVAFGVGVRRDDGGDNMKVVIPLHRVESHLIPESGRIACEHAGIYEIKFDNSYSWMTRKDITYKITVTPPTEDAQSS